MIHRRLITTFLGAGLLVVGGVATSGCGPEGAGTIKIENPNAARAKGGGGEVKSKKPLAPGAKKVLEEEKNAPTKHFQRG